MPVLIHIKTIKRGFTAKVFERDVGDVPRTTRVCFYESDIVALDDGYVAGMLNKFNIMQTIEA